MTREDFQEMNFPTISISASRRKKRSNSINASYKFNFYEATSPNSQNSKNKTQIEEEKIEVDK